MSSSPQSPKPIIAVFDFDGTLTYTDSLLPFFRHVSGPIRFYLGLMALAPAALGYLAGILSRQQFKERFVRFYLAGKSSHELKRTLPAFIHGRLQDILNPVAMDKLRWHQKNGHRIILLSASPETYLAAWAESHSLELVATRLEETEGRFSGRIRGSNCHGPEKLKRLEELLGNPDAFEIYAYGDSPSDRFVLEKATHAEMKPFRGSGAPARWLVFLRSLL